MPNRDYDDSQYNRSEGRFENRDEQSYRGSSDWDHHDDPRSHGGSHGSDYQNREQYPQRSSQYGQGRGGSSYGSGRGTQYGSSYGNSGERDGQRLGQQEWNRSVSAYRPGGSSYGRQDFARQDTLRGRDWDDRSQFGSYAPEWRSSPQGVPDYDTQRSAFAQQNWASDNRADNPFNAQERSRQEWNRTLGAGNYGRSNYAQPSYGQERYGRREEEGWGEQIRQAGQQVVRSVKRVFRGPKGYKRSDERIREDVNDRLAQQFDFDPSDVEVQVSAGEVTLTGTVQSRHEKFIAEEIADDVGGVNEVHNQLRVRRADLTSTAATSSSTTSVGSSTLGEGNNNNRNSPRA
jgi:osmotically-inducible protein OsmY